jgi:hypothetical protein
MRGGNADGQGYRRSVQRLAAHVADHSTSERRPTTAESKKPLLAAGSRAVLPSASASTPPQEATGASRDLGHDAASARSSAPEGNRCVTKPDSPTGWSQAALARGLGDDRAGSFGFCAATRQVSGRGDKAQKLLCAKCAVSIGALLRKSAGWHTYRLTCVAKEGKSFHTESNFFQHLGATAMTNHAPQLTRKQFRAICDEHDIPARDRAALAGLVYYGKPVGKALHGKLDGRWRCSRKNGVYAKCMEALLAALTADSPHKFPPKDYRAPKDYNYYC